MNRDIRSGRIDHYVIGNFRVKINIQTLEGLRPWRDVREIVLARIIKVPSNSKLPLATLVISKPNPIVPTNIV